MTRRDLIEEVRARVRTSTAVYVGEDGTEYRNRHCPTRPFIAETLKLAEAAGLFEWRDGVLKVAPDRPFLAWASIDHDDREAVAA